MPFLFEYRGGTVGEDKLHCFMLLPTNATYYEEAHIGEAGKRRFVTGPSYDGTRYETDLRYLKVSVSQVIHGMKSSQSFYMELLNDPMMPMITIKNPSTPYVFYFKGRARFLKREEVISLLPAGSKGLLIFLRQKTYSVEFLRKMITIDRPKFKVTGRRLALPKQKTEV